MKLLQTAKGGTKPRVRILLRALICVAVLLSLALAAAGWLAGKASTIKYELEAAAQLIPELKRDVEVSDTEQATATVDAMRRHTSSARDASRDPLWTLAAAIPVLGANFSAISEVARTADDVTSLAVSPLIRVLESLHWDSLMPSNKGVDLKPLQEAAPVVASAAHAVKTSEQRLQEVDEHWLLPEVAGPLVSARSELGAVAETLDAVADSSKLAPQMMGAGSARNYLLIIQNNAESRASGGIPGALATLRIENGKLELTGQSSATELGTMSPPLSSDLQQEQIYSTRLGKYMQDVNLTPDFPTSATIASRMWEMKTGERVDGVISIDPVALSYILKATGPVQLNSPELEALELGGLPYELTADNVVSTLLSDVYAKINRTQHQDAYFASVAQEIFGALAEGQGDVRLLMDSFAKAASENRILVWSATSSEQSLISKYPLSGAIAGPSISPAGFGVYFNDGTGAKMDYYVKRTVQLIKECTNDGYEQTTVRIASTNTAPGDAASSLPEYVTGDGNFGVPPGSVQTNLVAYGPVQANVETAKLDGQRTEFAPYVHSDRPVGILAIRLAPGESKIVEFTFGKIVQHTEPQVVVTPTVQQLKDVILPTKNAACGQGS